MPSGSKPLPEPMLTQIYDISYYWSVSIGLDNGFVLNKHHAFNQTNDKPILPHNYLLHDHE